MEPNTLLVHISCARGLYLKNHNQIEAYASITLQGKGSTKSRVVTEHVQSTGDCRWDEHCEFKLSEKSTHVVVAVQHKTKLGTSDLIGNCEIPLEQVRQLGSLTWFQLKKKKNDEKYRGEVQLQFTSTYEKSNLSISTMSLNKVEKESTLSKMKRKIKMAKTKQQDDTISMASGISSFSVQSTKSNRFFNKLNKTFGGGGLHKSTTLPPNTMSKTFNDAVEEDYTLNDNYDSPRYLSPNMNSLRPVSANSANNYSHNGSVLSLTNQGAPIASSTPVFTAASPSLSTAESFRRGNSVRSNGSSGFGSGKQQNNKTRDIDNYTQNDLMAEVDSLRLELQVKDARMRDMQEYVDNLIARVIDKCPEVLAAPAPQKPKRRIF